MAADSGKQTLGIWMTTALVIGNMIGAGIFMMPAALAGYGGISIFGWLVSSVGALLLARVFSALTRMISAVFRRGGDVSFVVEELKAVFDPRGGAWMGGKYIPSILAAIGGVIEQHMIRIGFIEGEGMGLKADPKAQVVNLDAPRGKACPSCGQFDMRMVEGCMTCGSCGHSKCG